MWHYWVIAGLCLGLNLRAAEPITNLVSAVEPPRVLIGNSYHPGYWWSDGEMKGVIDGLRERWPTLQPHVEFLDQKRFQTADHEARFLQYIKQKYEGFDWDLIIFVDSASLLAALKYPDWIGSTPVVFCGVEEGGLPTNMPIANITGVYEQRDETGTVELMWQLLQKTKEAYFLGGQYERVRELIAASFPDRPLAFHHLTGYDLDQLLDAVETLPPDAVIIEIGYQGRSEELLGPEYKRELAQRSAVPIFTHYDHGDAWGLGGRVIHGEHQGRLAAGLGLRILAGEEAGDIPAIREQAVQTIVDHREMLRFDIPFSRIPAEAVIRNQPPPLLQEYRNYLLLLGGFAGGVSVVALLLGRANYRRRMLFEHASDAIFILDLRGAITEVNAAAAEMFRCRIEDLVGQRFSNLIERHDLARNPFRLRETLSGSALRSQRLLQRFDDSTFVADCNTSRLPGGRLQGIVRDISEREEAEARLRESEERFRLATEAVEEVIYEWHPDTDEVIRSTAMSGVTGHELAETENRGKWWFSRIHPDDVEDARKIFGEAMREQDGFSLEYRVRHKEGHYIYVWDRGRIVRDDTGKVTKCVGSTTNLTERRHLEAQLRQAQKMEAIGTLAGGIAHDFNNILTGVVGSAELAKLDLSADDPARLSIDDILKASKRAGDLVTQILTFSRQGETLREEVDLLPTIREAHRFLRATIPADIEIYADYPENLPKVSADPSQIYQSLLNLGTNSWHALEGETGRIEVVVTTRRFLENEARPAEDLSPGKYVVLTVKDDGPGMTAEVRERIFEPFFTTKDQGRGTGLGLSVVHGIMHSHGGAITVEAEPGQGTTFHLYLPVAECSSVGEAKEADSDTIYRGSGQRVMVVDDEPLVRGTVGQILTHLGYETKEIEDPINAIGVLERDPEAFDLVLTDLSMPGMNGTEFARSAWAVRKDLPIVLMTGHLRNLELDDYLNMGFRDVVQKPITVQSMSRSVAQIFATKV